MQADRVLPGHEHVFTDLKGRMEEIIGHHSKREEEIRRTLEKKTLNAFEISSMITWDVPEPSWDQIPPLHKRFAVTETISHLELMRREGKAEKVDRNGCVAWATT
jgi:hypothetical protein